jgi:hypothetical protein
MHVQANLHFQEGIFMTHQAHFVLQGQVTSSAVLQVPLL